MKKLQKNTKLLLTFLAFFSVSFTSIVSLSSLQIPVAIAQNNSKAEADRLRQQGEQQLAAGQYVFGTETLERAMRMYQQIGDTETYKELLQRIYLIYITRGNESKTQLIGEEIIKTFSQDSAEETQEFTSEFVLDLQVNELIGQGRNYQQHNPVAAKKYFEQALSQAQSIGKEPEKIAAIKAMAILYLYEGDYVNALAKIKAVEPISAARYQDKKQAAASGDDGQIYNYFSEITNHRLPVLLLMSEIYLQQNNPNPALTYLQEASTIVTEIDQPSFKYPDQKIYVHPSLYLSRAYYSLGKYDQALSYARKAIEKAKTPNPSTNFFGIYTPEMFFPILDFGDGHGHVLAGIASAKLGNFQQAEQDLKQAIQIFENNRKKSASQANIQRNLDFFENQVRATYHLQRVLLAQNKSGEALAAAEWGRNRILLEATTAPTELTLEEKVNAFIDARYTPESICKIEAILIHLSGDPCNGQELIQELKESYLEEIRENPQALDTLTAGSPSNTAPSNIQPPNVEQLKQIAKSHQATLVEYSIISETTFFHPGFFYPGTFSVFDDKFINRNALAGEPEKLVIWVIKPTGEITSRQIDLKQQKINLKNLVTKTRQTMGLNRSIGVSLKPGAEVPENLNRSSSGVPAQEQLKQLHKLLIEPIADLLPKNPEAKVVFVPHQELFLVPFAALIDSQNNYLIEKHTILTAPSIQALEITRQKQQKQTQPGKLALVVGNPTMPTITLPNQLLPIQLRNLPGAEREGKEVAKFLDTKFLTGDKATKTEVLKQLPQARYIHLATHGLLEDYANFGVPGAIALAPSTIDNGLLNASEIQELNLTAELAVLSACDTGGGNITGDGVVGLSRSLIVAGVPSIVVSLWAIPDLETADLMVEFYSNFQKHKLDKAQALRQAMLTIKKDYPNPLYWAGFTLIGQWK
ncbi:CHAT domain-containing tetratricopeptide repeat protein [Nodularia chucula]|uniref:CHAT domain-containing tetratricopeptide repeat protein n=1 Tax=Nodularia chucula TaxID=3093667 RepID=UPI0039C71FDF